MYQVASQGEMLLIAEFTDNGDMVQISKVPAELAMQATELQAEVERLRETLDRVRITIESRGMTNKGIYVSMPSEYVGLIHKMAQHALK